MTDIRNRYARITTNLEPEYVKQLIDEYKDSIEIKHKSFHQTKRFYHLQINLSRYNTMPI